MVVAVVQTGVVTFDSNRNSGPGSVYSQSSVMREVVQRGAVEMVVLDAAEVSVDSTRTNGTSNRAVEAERVIDLHGSEGD